MVRNKLEKLFSKSQKDQFQWGMKLHNNPLAHQTTPADYIVSMKDDDSVYHEHKFMLMECKQVTCKRSQSFTDTAGKTPALGKGRLAFKRLKQMHDLLAFEAIHGKNSAFFVVAFYDGRWNNSEVYMVPINQMKNMVDNYGRVSINRQDMKSYFPNHILKLEGGILQCTKLLRSL